MHTRILTSVAFLAFAIPAAAEAQGFSDDATAEQVVREIMEAIGEPAGSVTARPGDVPNASLRSEGSTYVILYNPAYLERAKAQAGPAAIYQIIAHEVGHMIIRMSPRFEAGRSRRELELEADHISGAILFNLNATLDEAVSAPQMLTDEEGSATHPPTRERIRAVVAGWNEAKRRSNGHGLHGAFFASNLGIHYERVPYSDGTFGARLTRPPARPRPGPGSSPATSSWRSTGRRSATRRTS
jgi:hypothetical protein